MKIDAYTINVLKNFSKINPSIIIKQGNVLRTLSIGNSVAAEATVPTSFPKDFAIYNLDRFISTVSLFDDPDFDFKDTYVVISSGNRNTRYMYCDENNLRGYLDKTLELPSVEAAFTLNYEEYKSIEKALGVMGLPEIVVYGDGKNISLQAVNSNQMDSDNFSLNIGETNNNFKAVFKSENIKIMPGNYQVELSAGGFANFKGEKIQYWISIEHNSEF